MLKKAAIIVLAAALATGCSKTKTPTAPPAMGPDPSGTLTEAATSVSRSLVELAQIEQAAHPLTPIEAEPNPNSYGMGATASVDWSGPIEPLITHLAQITSYKIRVTGNAPAIPVLVTVYAKNVPVADILRDAAYQCGKRAQVIVFPETKTLELRYALT